MRASVLCTRPPAVPPGSPTLTVGLLRRDEELVLVVAAPPAVDHAGQAVPPVPVPGREGRREDVVEVEGGDLAIPRGAVVKLNAAAELEGVLLARAVRVVRDVPGGGERGDDRAPGPVLDQAVVDLRGGANVSPRARSKRPARAFPLPLPGRSPSCSRRTRSGGTSGRPGARRRSRC